MLLIIISNLFGKQVGMVNSPLKTFPASFFLLGQVSKNSFWLAAARDLLLPEEILVDELLVRRVELDAVVFLQQGGHAEIW